MIKKFSKFKLLTMLMITVIVATSNITYADTALSQNNINIPSNWAKADIDKAKEINLVPKKIQGKNPFTDTQNTQVLIAYQL